VLQLPGRHEAQAHNLLHELAIALGQPLVDRM